MENTLKNPAPDQSEAEALAIEALVFLSGEEKRFQRFLSITGLDPSTLRQVAKQTNFLASILDYIMQDESLLLQFCEMNAIDPDLVPSSRTVLGKDLPGQFE